MVDSCVYAWGANGDEGRCSVPSAGRTNVVDVAAGREFSVALRKDGTLVAWGRSDVAGKIVGDLASDVAQVAAGERHVLVLKKDGRVLATGFNMYADECTVPDEALSDVVQVAAGERFSFALKRDRTVVAWGSRADDSAGVLDVPESLQGHATAIAAGHYHALAITDTGDVVEWGWCEGDAIPDGARTGATDIAACAPVWPCALLLQQGVCLGQRGLRPEGFARQPRGRRFADCRRLRALPGARRRHGSPVAG